MKLLIISPGKAHDHTVADGIAEYKTRLEKRLPIEWAFPKPDTKETEAAAILKLIKIDDFVILLDEKGKDLSTTDLAGLLDAQTQSGVKRLVFVIGGAFGVDDLVKERADLTFKLSSLIFPHMLVRLILVEQLYRAVTIIDGGKYHHR